MKLNIPHLIVFLVVFSISDFLMASGEKEIHEVRLAKAELALSQKKTDYALFLISRNFTPEFFHLDSYIFLADYYLRERRVSKAFRVYHYVVKKLHPLGGKRYLKAGNVKSVKHEFDIVKRPSEQALFIYFTLGQAYYNLQEKGVFAKSFNKQLLLNSKKYFTICDLYNFKTAETKFFLGTVNNKLEVYGEAIESLTIARELFIKEGKDSKSPDIQNIDFMLADSYIREGYTDSGSIFLQKIYQNPKASSSLKSYANVYLDAINAVYKVVTVGVGMIGENNIHSLGDQYKENFDSYNDKLNRLRRHFSLHLLEESERENPLVGPTVLYNTKRFNYYFSSKRYGKLSYIVNVDLSENLISDDRQYLLESRTLFLAATIKRDDFYENILKFGYSYRKSSSKSSASAKFIGGSSFHTFNPEVVQTFKSGSLSYSVTLEVEAPKEGDIVTQRSYGLSFSPFWKNEYISPTFSLSFDTLDPRSFYNELTVFSTYDESLFELGTFDKADQTKISITNHLGFIKNLSTFITFDYTTFTTRDQNFKSSETAFEISFSYVFKFWNRMSSNYTIRKISRDLEFPLQSIALQDPDTFVTTDEEFGPNSTVSSTSHTLNLSINF